MNARIRNGFTLVELLVVIAIIGVLIALTAGAVFQVQESQRASNTETVMRTANKVLEQQWRAVIDQANKEDLPANVLTLANGDPRRARVMWKCLRLAQEFPMSFNEARAGITGYLPPKSVYTSPIGAGSAAPEIENSTLLVLALQQTRAGVSLSPDNIPGSVVDTNGDGLKELVDGYGNPMIFFRFPTGSAELNSKNPAKAGSRSAKFPNPLDPDGTLLDPSWNNSANGNVAAFQTLSGMQVQDASGQPMPRYMVPTLVSAGRNAKFGLDNLTMGVTNANDDNDNIYSFRLALDKRGD